MIRRPTYTAEERRQNSGRILAVIWAVFICVAMFGAWDEIREQGQQTEVQR